MADKVWALTTRATLEKFNLFSYTYAAVSLSVAARARTIDFCCNVPTSLRVITYLWRLMGATLLDSRYSDIYSRPRYDCACGAPFFHADSPLKLVFLSEKWIKLWRFKLISPFANSSNQISSFANVQIFILNIKVMHFYLSILKSLTGIYNLANKSKIFAIVNTQ